MRTTAAWSACATAALWLLAAVPAPLPPPHLLCPYTAAAWEFARHIQPGCGREVYEALCANCSTAPPYSPPQERPRADLGSLLGSGAVVVDPAAGSDSRGDGTAARPFATLARGILLACSAEHVAAGKVRRQPTR